MPNRFACSSFDKNPNTLPLCGPLSGCKYYYNVIGDVHQDTSINCLIDSLKKGNGLSNIKLQLRSNGNIVRQTSVFTIRMEITILLLIHLGVFQ